MDYEKAYKEALERAQKAADNGMVSQNFVDDIFQLKESKDEKIRKEIRNFLIDMECKGDWIAYIEKQKEQKSEQSETEKEYVRTLQSLISDFLRGKQHIDREYYQKIWDWLDNRHIPGVYIPKFKVGDIIQHVPLEKWDRSARVRAIDENGYSIDYTHIGDTVSGGYIGFSFENEYELVEQKPAEYITDAEMKRSMNSLHDFKVFAANLAKQFNITHKRDIDWHNFCAGLLTYLERNKPAEWSEEEIDKVVVYLHERDGGMLWSKAKEIASDICDILRPCSHWKPSKEQMEALWNTLHPDDPYYVDLSSLYNDLKKL